MDKPVQMPNQFLDTAECLDLIVKRMRIDSDFTLMMVKNKDLEHFLKENGYELSGAPLEVLNSSMKKIRGYIADQSEVLEKKVDDFVRGMMESGNGAGGWS